MQAVPSNSNHPEYGVVTINLPISKNEYDQVIERLAAIKIGDASKHDCYVSERLDNTGRVTGAFDIDLDKGTFEVLHIMDGWQCFRIQDISTAAYFAMKKSSTSQDER